MENTLGKNSGIVFLKSKFFIVRALTYSSFLLIPVWAQKTLQLSLMWQLILMFFYILFVAGQWFLLGKEIDHRLKIYFKINSSFDRIVYRLILGMIVFAIYFNILGIMPYKWSYNFFWVTWIILGLFYSWPTRGKIIKESVTSHFGEFHYLDRFEKTLLFLIIGFFFVSFPEMPNLVDFEALKLFFDPLDKIHILFWTFLKINYHPFLKYPELLKVALCMHFYVLGLGLFLVTLYTLLRYFVSRRLSLLGVFVLLSSWSLTKILSFNCGSSMLTTFSIFWIWSTLWVSNSSSYRAGLFIGLLGFWGALINQSFAFLLIIQLLILYFVFLQHKTLWFRNKFIRYSLIGLFLLLIVIFYGGNDFDSVHSIKWENLNYFKYAYATLERKAFFMIAPLGLLIVILKLFFSNHKIFESIKLNIYQHRQLFILLLLLFIFSCFSDDYLVKDFSLMWPFVLWGLVPLEVVFQKITRLRSNRNLIYLIYIVICLLDSHVEGRIKIIASMLSQQ